MAEKVLTARDAKLIQWLDEAHAKESELIASLTAHIKATEKMAYKKRLRKHLTETRDHRRKVAARDQEARRLGQHDRYARPGRHGHRKGRGGCQGTGRRRSRSAHPPAGDPPAKRPGGAARGAGRDCALHAHRDAGQRSGRRRHRASWQGPSARDEERMAKFLQAELVRLVKDVVRAEIPRDQRASSRRSTARRRSSSRSTSARSAASRARAAA